MVKQPAPAPDGPAPGRADSHEMLLGLNIEEGTPSSKSPRESSSCIRSFRVHPSASGLSRCSTARGASSHFSKADTMAQQGPQRIKSRRQPVVFSLAAGSAMKNVGHAHFTKAASRWVFFPNTPTYMGWWYLTIVVAVVNAWFTPFTLAFAAYPGLYPLHEIGPILDIISFTVFAADIALKMHTAYFDPRTNMMVTDLAQIRSNYLRGLFWVDFVSTFPFDVPILFALGLNGSDSNTARYICLLKLFRLIRVYRLIEFFDYVEYNMILGQITLMLIRNITYVVFVTHWAGCLIWFIARSEYFAAQGSWVGRHVDRFTGISMSTQYVYSWYMMMASFTGMGDNDFYSNSPYESTFMIFYQVICLVLGAYILGSVTLLVVKGDERAAVLRSRNEAIKNYAGVNNISDDLLDAMIANMELHFHNELFSDQTILHAMPTTIRRKVLRHLYDSQLRDCYLFSGCSSKFIDAVLSAGHIENYMAGVQLIAPGDVCNELSVIVTGTVVTYVTSLSAGHGEAPHLAYDGLSERSSATFAGSSVHLPSSRPTKEVLLSTSHTFGEVSFFTELPAIDPAMTTSVCKIMLISRAAYVNLQLRFPDDIRLVLENLQRSVTEVTQEQLMQASPLRPLGSATLSDVADALTACSPSMSFTAKRKEQELLDTLSPPQVAAVEVLRSVQTHVNNFCIKMDKERISAFLEAASTGDDVVVKQMLSMGIPVDSADLDHRTALMLAVQKGNKDVVKLLLDAGADTQLRCCLGGTALLVACRQGNDMLVEKLMKRGATLNLEPEQLASHLCECALKGNVAFLRRLLLAGALADTREYSSRRTALHIAAGEGNLQAVRLLVEEGEATIDLQDHWGNTPLDEAKRVGASSVVAYIESLMDKTELFTGKCKWRRLRTSNFLSACTSGNVERIRYLLEGDTPAALATGLMLAAAQGHKPAVGLLQTWTARDLMECTLSQAMLIEAIAGRHDDVAALLASSGASLSKVPQTCAAALLMGTVADNAINMLRKLLKAGLRVEAAGASHRTAVHAAAELSNLDALRVLIEEGGARHDVPDFEDRTPLEAARAANADPSITAYLEWAATMDTIDRSQATLRFGMVRTASDRVREASLVEPKGTVKRAASRLGILKGRSRDYSDDSASPRKTSMPEVPPLNLTGVGAETPTAAAVAVAAVVVGPVPPFLTSVSTNNTPRSAARSPPQQDAANNGQTTSQANSRPSSPFVRAMPREPPRPSVSFGAAPSAADIINNRLTLSERYAMAVRDNQPTHGALSSSRRQTSSDDAPHVDLPPPSARVSFTGEVEEAPSSVSRRSSLRPGLLLTSTDSYKRMAEAGGTDGTDAATSSAAWRASYPFGGPMIMQQNGSAHETEKRSSSRGELSEFTAHEIESLLKEVEDMSASVAKGQ